MKPDRTYTLERHTAIEAVTEAASLCEVVRREMVGLETLTKDDRSPVTLADFGSQALVCLRLAEAFKDDPIVAEEDASALRAAPSLLEQVTTYVARSAPATTPNRVCAWIDRGRGRVARRFWTLDPIDGTKGFLRNDQYAIALALIEEGEVKVAALACPALPLDLQETEGRRGVVFVAVQGAGAQMAPAGSADFRDIRVASHAQKAAWRFVESVEAAHGNRELQEDLARQVGITRPALRMDSQAKYGVLARGDAVLYLRLPSPATPEYREKIWDHAAGSLIVREAGGRVSDMSGHALDLASGRQMMSNRGVVAGNPALHRAALAALAAARPKWDADERG